ncbi:MAG: HAMP domain-containing protein [Planctomycetaceae bacterium]|nr:HAMP domain-containing protein [Planctomycetaceae bacterium]
MRLSLRWRLSLTMAPLFLILAGLGGTGVALLYRVGNRIDAILRENYRSVTYMTRLNEALERVDSSFTFALSGREDAARQQYAANSKAYRENLAREQENVTLPGERERAERLTALSESYQRDGDAFFELPAGDAGRANAYHAPGGLLDRFREIKKVSGEILLINQQSMENASEAARSTAVTSLTFFGTALAITALLAVLLAWGMIRSILDPIRAVTHSALEISAGQFDQVIPIDSGDEIGQLAHAFNTMAHRLRDYRQSHSAQLLRAQRTSQATIDSFPDPVLVIDTDGEVEMANPASRRLLGVVPKQSDQAGTGLWQPPEPLRQPLEEALRGRRNFLPEGFEQVLLFGSNGRERAVLPRIMTIRDPHDHTLGAAVLLQDVTRLRLLDQVKSNLVATASHELKTPLTSIRLAVHVLLQESVGALTPKQTELLVDARDNCERLLAVVNNLLDLARMEPGSRQLDVHVEPARNLLQAAADAVSVRARDNNVELTIETPDNLPPVLADASRMGHALRNLLDNALIYTDPGGKITLSAAAEGNEVILSVADTGCGIAPEHLPHVFEKFFRVPGQKRAGTGLGLAIVQEIVTAHGGSVTCDSQVGVGTTFRIRLPSAAR